MNSRAQLEKALSSRLSGIQITNQLSGLSRAKAPPPVLKSHSIVPQKSLKFIPHPPQKGRPVGLQSGTGAEGKSIKPVPPAEPRAKRPSVRKFYDVRKQDGVIDESRICGDGESLENEEYYEKSRCPSWERIPGDGCISDIAEEDEDAEEENDEAEENDDDDDDDEDGNCDNDFYECDELDEAGFSDNDDDDDDGSQSMISTAASSRVSTAKSRASSARVSNLSRWSGAVGSSKPCSSASSKKTNAWASTGDDKQEKVPPLVPSLFVHVPATVYFFTEGEKVAQLPTELRKLLRWKMSSITPNVIKQCIARAGFKPTKRNDWLGYWGKHMKATCFKTVREYQKVNHFPGTFQIGRKDRLWRNLSRMMVHHGKKEYGFVPQTYILPYDFKLLKRAWDDGSSRQKWILKPPASARGIGIRVIHKWNQIPRKRPVIVQRYLAKPLLINSSKFDLRIYVYVTSYDPLRIYVFEDGLVRFATCKYSSSMKSLSNKFMHLTNYSINKKNEGAYQANSDETVCQGHKWSLKALWGYMKRININHAHVWETIKDLVVKAILASDSAVNTMVKQNVRKRSCCHELFGFDVMLDENLKPWLLEVNISPSLHSTSQLDRNIKGQMIKDLFNLAGFCIPENLITTSTSSTSNMNQFVQDKGGTGLSSDERAKHAFYVQRHLDERTKQSVLDIMTPDDIRMLIETEDENSRRGCFQRVFPSLSSNKYLRFFESQRYYNILLDEWTRKYMREGRSTALGVAVLQGYAEKKLHIGPTSDSTHQWTCPQDLTYRSSSAPALGLDHGFIKSRKPRATPRSKSAPSRRRKNTKHLENSTPAGASAPVLLPKIKKKSTKVHASKTCP
ncbi:Tubulin polyglutamylase ttll4 [Desmophyllum pertusum]|uniref:Tubulin polyglutamylase ttll4 n=1 Tax=Desmophyllum pertusum TaxID=174260 RepID=A0A9X0CCM1_9CNID|nr:Tubulin polyglutamylase ttll4 [Desmophyllum pertusum]